MKIEPNEELAGIGIAVAICAAVVIVATQIAGCQKHSNELEASIEKAYITNGFVQKYDGYNRVWVKEAK